MFLCYRREDRGGHALSIRQYLDRELGEANVFIDIEDLQPGENFEQKILATLTKCRVMIVAIGPDWLVDRAGRRRLEEPRDWVRAEIEEGLRQRLKIIPVLVDGAHLPAARDLPPSISVLPSLQSLPISIAQFKRDMSHLVVQICEASGVARRQAADTEPRTRGWVAAGALALIVAAGAAGVGLGWRLGWPSAYVPGTSDGRAPVVVATPGHAGDPVPARDPFADMPIDQVLRRYRDLPNDQQGMAAQRLIRAHYKSVSPLMGRDPTWSPPGNRLPDHAQFHDCDLCPDMLVVPPVAFVMGTPEKTRDDLSKGNEAGAHQQEFKDRRGFLRRFAIGIHEVTITQFQAFLRNDPSRRGWVWECHDGSRPEPEPEKADSMPANCVSFDDALKYVAWLSAHTGRHYRLPTEAQWEAAARAGTTTRFSFGDNLQGLCQHANGAAPRRGPVTWMADVLARGPQIRPCTDEYIHIAPVGALVANPYGLRHVHGNLAEWVLDCYHSSYRAKPDDLKRDGNEAWGNALNDCERADKKDGVTRGGSYLSPPAELRSAARVPADKQWREAAIGFRVARLLDD